MDVIKSKGNEFTVKIGEIISFNGQQQLVLDNVITQGANPHVVVAIGEGVINTTLKNWNARLENGRIITFSVSYAQPAYQDRMDINRMCFVAKGVGTTNVGSKQVVHMSLVVMDTPIGNAIKSVIEFDVFKLWHHHGPNNIFETVVLN